MPKEWKTRRGERAVVCLLAASLCGLPGVVIGLVLMPVVGLELRFADGAGAPLEISYGYLQECVLSCARATAVSLVMATLTWRWGAAWRTRIAGTAGCLPHLLWPLNVLLGAGSAYHPYMEWYPAMLLGLAGAAGSLYLAGVVLAFSSGPGRRAVQDRRNGAREAATGRDED
ncbi:hypothetical protein ACFQ08_17205, partial [Streptosporangium algeriense]